MSDWSSTLVVHTNTLFGGGNGYAGRGRYADGTAGSAELILQIAENQLTKVGITWKCFFVEKDADSFASLTVVVDEYVAKGVSAVAVCSDVEPQLATVLTAASGEPLFLFLDPCGLGLPYDRLVGTLNDQTRKGNPTEVLLNFSLGAVRRIGGHVKSPSGNEAILQRLDEAVGGDWWRRYFKQEHDDPVAGVVKEFVSRLAKDTKMTVVALPVRRTPHHEPLYYLVFGTRSPHGLWWISDAAARASDEWRKRHAGEQNTGNELFDLQPETLESIEAKAVADIANNIEQLLVTRDQFQVLDHTSEILGSHIGEVRGTVVRKAIKQLYKEGKTSCNGKGKDWKLVVTRPSS